MLTHHHIHTDPFSPYSELFRGSSAKCIASGKQNFFAIILKTMCQFANRGRLPRAIYTDDKNYMRLCPDINPQWFAKRINKPFFKNRNRIPACDFSILNRLVQFLDYLFGCDNSHICTDENFFYNVDIFAGQFFAERQCRLYNISNILTSSFK